MVHFGLWDGGRGSEIMIGVFRTQSICRVLGHKRSRSQARPFATTWSSKCYVCGQRIVRVKHRQWILMKDVHRHASSLFGPTFAHAWPIDRSFCFDDLLDAIDLAILEREQHRAA